MDIMTCYFSYIRGNDWIMKSCDSYCIPCNNKVWNTSLVHLLYRCLLDPFHDLAVESSSFEWYLCTVYLGVCFFLICIPDLAVESSSLEWSLCTCYPGVCFSHLYPRPYSRIIFTWMIYMHRLFRCLFILNCIPDLAVISSSLEWYLCTVYSGICLSSFVSPTLQYNHRHLNEIHAPFIQVSVCPHLYPRLCSILIVTWMICMHRLFRCLFVIICIPDLAVYSPSLEWSL